MVTSDENRKSGIKTATAAAGAPAPSIAPRRDIQALRAFAVMAVVGYHIVPKSLPGGFVGVDIFFVVSGFLIGGALVEEAVATGRVALGRFYARRVRRIAPLATLTAIVTAIVAALTLSPLRLILWGSPAGVASITRDGIASVLGVANVWFGYSDVGYAMSSYVSPFTHYWSLGVEEQFYLIAPLVIALAFRAGRKVGALIIGAWSIIAFDLTLVGFGTAGLGTFYSPFSRSWELGIGVLVAVAVPALRAVGLRIAVATVAVWISWAALAGCVIAIATPIGWPNVSALIPVIATAGILAAGSVREARRLASLSWLQWLGDRSYGVYLWHWPVIAIAVPRLPLPREATWAVGIALTLALSAASFRWIERPVRRLPISSRAEIRRVFAGGILAIGCGLAVIGGLGVWASTSTLATSTNARPYALLPAGASQQEFATTVPFNLRPDLRNASSDRPGAYVDGCNVQTVYGEVDAPDCIYGLSGPLVALFGDSHALQWLSALLPAVNRGEIRVALVTADACPPFDPASLDYREVCAEWHRVAISRINELKPDLIVASASLSEPALTSDAAVVAATAAMGRLPSELNGGRVLWIVDTPALDEDPSTCAAADITDITSCNASRKEALSPRVRAPIQAAVVANGWQWLDLNDYMCDESECGIILGDVFVYRDDDHLTSTFVRELTPLLMQAISPLVNGANVPMGTGSAP